MRGSLFEEMEWFPILRLYISLFAIKANVLKKGNMEICVDIMAEQQKNTVLILKYVKNMNNIKKI